MSETYMVKQDAPQIVDHLKHLLKAVWSGAEDEALLF